MTETVSPTHALAVTIVGGYLGSGKTTLINHLLRNANGVRLAVMVNDFGELPIDADLIEAEQGDVISLSGGCICCSYGDDLSLALATLQDNTIKPEHVFIEASGVALPGAIGSTLSLLRAYRLEGIVVVADANSVTKLIKEKYIGDTIDRQLCDADLVVLSKRDLLSLDEATNIDSWITEHYPGTPMVSAINGNIPTSVFFQSRHQQKTQAAASQSRHDVSCFESTYLNATDKLCAQALVEQLTDSHCGLIRAKGFVQDLNGAMQTIQIVGRRASVTPAPAGVRSGFVCIGLKDRIDFDAIQAAYNSAVYSASSAR